MRTKNSIIKHLVLLTIFSVAISFSYAQERIYTLYLVGDAGKIVPGQKRVYKTLKDQMKITGEKSGVIFLGDNIYPQGMASERSPNREETEKVADEHIALVDGFAGHKIFIPGNHDWAQGRKTGWTNLLNQELYLENHLDSTNVFMPSGGCPGPVEVELNDEIVLIILDTQWFLHNWSKPDEEQGGCESANVLEIFQLLEGMMQKNAHKKVVVATHHPMYTYGSHGGFFPTITHFKPPILGSIHPIYRKFIGSPQDITHPKNKAVRDALVDIYEKFPNTVHVAGHEHSMQYSYKDSVHYVVSGSISKTSFVRKKGYAEYAESAHGFGRLDFYSNGDVKVSFHKPLPDGEVPVTFEKLLMNKPFVEPEQAKEYEAEYDFSDSTVVTQASYQYEAKAAAKKLFGENYRDVWKTKIEVPIFDIGKEKGGLKIVQRGGGMQTKSLRLEAADGRQYVLRSIEKYPENAVPEILRNTFAVDLVQDQISAAHPYGALVVPFLADAAGIYHTNPKIVYIPEDVRFGEHKKDFAATLALFEERPAKDWSDADFFGNSPDIENTNKVVEELQEDNDNEVDQRFTLKSRLFDLIIGDWDRHDDQWRWAETDKKGKGKMYRPIPRDRDQAFFVNEGFFPEIWSRKWALPKFEGFDYDVDWTSGFMFNARYFDRTFLTNLSKEQWVEVAKELQESLTDEKIEKAINQWPEPIYELSGKEVTEKIKARRDKLVDYALDHYLFLAKEVDVLGSDKHEHFQVNRLDNGDVHVIVHKMKKDGEIKHKIYDRIFKFKETKEIRLYGLRGEDKFVVDGESKKSIKVRIIGGPGEDELVDKSKVIGPAKKTIFYDSEMGNVLALNKESRNELSGDEAVNFYNRKAFEYDVLTPLITANFNQDDGIFLGGGFVHTSHGFRKDPFKQRHKLLASYAFNTASFNFEYNGLYTDALGSWDLQTDVRLRAPDFANNFFGLGNDTEFDRNIDETVNVNRSIDYYRLRFEEMAVNVGLFKNLGPFGRVGGQLNYYNWELEDLGGRERFVGEFLQDQNLDIEDQTFNYVGGTAHLEVDTRKDKNVPTAGIFWDNEINTFYGIDGGSGDFHQFGSSLALYMSFEVPARVTFATRFGYAANLGDYPFFMGQTLGGKYEIRGYRKTRFYGDRKFYNNTEVRIKLTNLKTYLFPASLGVLAFHDVGRVWLEEENSDTWHNGIGGGIWFTPFNMAALSAEVGRSSEETLFYVRLGFLF
ncbi:hypothetical protein E1176_16410 [Fulvivirga sp. RKSG066]|uniref:metallophosphoesterase n=1 Tax=Fulvivirga aurantia TaxID=2529383 RepID=UPI0012BD5CA8|nr:metallophosphoesterase [Fulvivirga aurantia]MTI22616.1 hypothetical protein [Fulvivirga aurantia]